MTSPATRAHKLVCQCSQLDAITWHKNAGKMVGGKKEDLVKNQSVGRNCREKVHETWRIGKSNRQT